MKAIRKPRLSDLSEAEHKTTYMEYREGFFAGYRVYDGKEPAGSMFEKTRGYFLEQMREIPEGPEYERLKRLAYHDMKHLIRRGIQFNHLMPGRTIGAKLDQAVEILFPGNKQAEQAAQQDAAEIVQWAQASSQEPPALIEAIEIQIPEFLNSQQKTEWLKNLAALRQEHQAGIVDLLEGLRLDHDQIDSEIDDDVPVRENAETIRHLFESYRLPGYRDKQMVVSDMALGPEKKLAVVFLEALDPERGPLVSLGGQYIHYARDLYSLMDKIYPAFNDPQQHGNAYRTFLKAHGAGQPLSTGRDSNQAVFKFMEKGYNGPVIEIT